MRAFRHRWDFEMEEVFAENEETLQFWCAQTLEDEARVETFSDNYIVIVEEWFASWSMTCSLETLLCVYNDV